ncbi:PREDICTED: transmembrane protein 241-like isoform X2 [Priapulus caudatus]|uniref:Transmembrane protein 241-like isoform X2 n=1 Tax=Priapulus caudatus TaxID=37621 RepID=A0ABM1EYL1_PRICU|nr:PREDICTED: transmembrane protein 241-like isoform X2 [Priapulus caudatus]
MAGLVESPKLGMTKEALSNIPVMVIYTCSIYTGSKALSQLPIPIFVCLHNILLPIMILGRLAFAGQMPSVRVWLSASLLIVSTFAAGFSLSIDDWTPYWWMLAHISSAAFYHLYRLRSDCCLHEGKIAHIFQCYLFSVLVLAPASVFLGDALAAQSFPLLYFYRFYVGCVISGFLGALLQLYVIRLEDGKAAASLCSNTEYQHVVSKVVAVPLSFLTFDDLDTSKPLLPWMMVNLGASVALSCWKPASEGDAGATTATRENTLL